MTMFDIVRKLVKPQSVDVEKLLNISGLRERNEARMAKIKEEMGDKWILHPSHKKSKLVAPRPV